MIDGSDLQAARAAANELTAMTALSEARYLRALNAQVTGSLLLAEGDAAGALKLLRQAWIDWQDIDAPWEAGGVRVLLGMTCRALGDEETAQLEFGSRAKVPIRTAGPDADRRRSRSSDRRRQLPGSNGLPTRCRRWGCHG